VLDVGLVAVRGAESCQADDGGENGDEEGSFTKFTLGRALCERIGRRRKFFWTLLRS
jgi:hypothetical protein